MAQIAQPAKPAQAQNGVTGTKNTNNTRIGHGSARLQGERGLRIKWCLSNSGIDMATEDKKISVTGTENNNNTRNGPGSAKLEEERSPRQCRSVPEAPDCRESVASDKLKSQRHGN